MTPPTHPPARLLGPLILVVIAFTLAACSDGDSTSPQVPTTIVAVEGDVGSAEVGSSIDLVVQVNDESGNGVPDKIVRWQVRAGDGSVSSSAFETNADGQAKTTWTLGTAAGVQSVRAEVEELSPFHFEVDATPGELASLEIEPAEIILQELGTTQQLSAVGADEYGNEITEVEVSWEVLDTSIASVGDDGMIEALDYGETEVVATSGSVEGTATVAVQQAPARIQLSPLRHGMSVGDTVEFKAVVFDEAGDEIEGAPVSWSSSDDDVATVDSEGVAVAHDVGDVEITAASGEQSASAELVIKAEANLTRIDITADRDTIPVGGELELEAEGVDQDDDAYPLDNLEWSSSDTTVATVDEDGLVTSHAAGEVTITAAEGEIEGKFELVVYGQLHNADIREDEVWRKADNPHWVTQPIKVYRYAEDAPDPATLTIEAGVEVRFYKGASLQINNDDATEGALEIEGVWDDSVTFTSAESTPQAGDWGGITYAGGDSGTGLETTIKYTTFEYCGAEGVACLHVDNDTRLTLEYVTIRESAGYGVRLSEGVGASFGSDSEEIELEAIEDYPIRIGANAVGSLPGEGELEFDDSEDRRIYIDGGRVSETQSWDNLGFIDRVTYVVSSAGIQIYDADESPTLTIEKRTKFLFEDDAQIQVGAAPGESGAGTLVIKGDNSTPLDGTVILTSVQDSPQPGAWKGIWFTENATGVPVAAGEDNLLKVTEMSYCGEPAAEGGACVRAQSDLIADRVTIKHSAGHGAHLSDGAGFGGSNYASFSGELTVEHSAGYPIWIDASSAGTVPSGSSFEDNAEEYIYIHPGRVDEDVFWGDHGIPYVLGASTEDDRMEVYADVGSTAAKLTVGENVELRMAEGAYLQAGHTDGGRGFFDMEGNENEPITITAHSNDPEPGFWDSVRQVGSNAGESTRLKWVIFEYGTNNFVGEYWPDMMQHEDNQFNHAEECGAVLPTTSQHPDLADIEARLLNSSNGNSATGNGSDICKYEED